MSESTGEKAAVSQRIRIRLPIPGIFFFAFLSLWGGGALLGSLEALTREPKNALNVCSGLILLALGIIALGVEAYWLLRIPSIVVNRADQTLSIRPFGPVLRLDKVRQVDVWRERPIGRIGTQIGSQYLWKVHLVFIGEQEVRVWQGLDQDKARRLAQELSDAVRKPWVGGREARPPP